MAKKTKKAPPKPKSAKEARFRKDMEELGKDPETVKYLREQAKRNGPVKEDPPPKPKKKPKPVKKRGGGEVKYPKKMNRGGKVSMPKKMSRGGKVSMPKKMARGGVVKGPYS